MNEFVYLYRRSPSAEQPSPEQMQVQLERWRAWMKALEAKGCLVSRGEWLPPSGGAVVKHDRSVIDGPYAETKDIVVGFTVVRAKDLAEAVELSAGCPALDRGMVEVRPVAKM